jgi:lipoprotein NlpD
VVDAARRISGIAYSALLLCLAGCVPLGTPMVSEVSRTQPVTGDVFVVRKGDTLYSIAWRAGKDYKELAQINDIAAPFIIFPGQRLRLVAPPVAKTARKSMPIEPTAAQDRTAKISESRSSVAASRQENAKPKPKPKPKTQASAAVVAKTVSKRPAKSNKRAPLVWVRPIKQAPSVGFGNGSKGWDYQIQSKIRMRSASGGNVVYAGNGIAGYERLVIVKHSGNLLSAYSFNGRILVSEQQTVRTGQSLAELVSRNNNKQKVHFELRRDGKPINPKSLIKPR